MTLIAAIIGDVEEKPPNEHRPEGEVVTVAQTVVTKIKRRQPVSRDVFQHGIEAAGIAREQPEQISQHTHQNRHLQYVAPDHRPDAPKHVIEHSKSPEYQYRSQKPDAGDEIDHSRDAINRDGRRE